MPLSGARRSLPDNGTLKAGAGYVPFDATQLRERLRRTMGALPETPPPVTVITVDVGGERGSATVAGRVRAAKVAGTWTP